MMLSETGEIVQKIWNEIPDHFDNAGLDCFIIMPNHIHGIITIEETFCRRDVVCNVSTGAVNMGDNTRGNAVSDNAGMENTGTGITMAGISPKTGSLSVVLRSFKSAATKRINESRKTPGETIWQSRYYDHIIRDRRELKRVREYISNNPQNWANDEMYGNTAVSLTGTE